MMDAPSAASATAIARLLPELDPVTTATRPSSFRAIYAFFPSGL